MAEVTNLKQVLVQALAVERLQEKSRRQGEVDQQQTTRRLADQAEIHGRLVEETPESEELRLDPEQEGEGETQREAKRRPARETDAQPAGAAEAAEETATDGAAGGATEEKGRRIDVQA